MIFSLDRLVTYYVVPTLLFVLMFVPVLSAEDEVLDEPVAQEEEATEQEVPQVKDGLQLKRNLNKLTALLVMDMGGGATGGSACDLIITAVDVADGESAAIEFNQSVGPMMRDGLDVVKRAIAVRHGKSIVDKDVSISFADKFSPKDGPSASLAVAMLLDSLVDDIDFQTGVAVTGDLTSDGKVRPIGGLDAKLRAAKKAGCAIICFPIDNAGEIDDIIVDGEIANLLGLQAIAVNHLDDALAVAKLEKDEDIASAIRTVDELLAAAREKGGAVLKSEESMEKLKKVLEVLPNHITAQVLVRYASGQLPNRYSILGSLVRLEEAMAELSETFGDLDRGGESALNEILSDNRLDNMYDRARENVMSVRNKMHPDVKRYEGAVSRYLQLLAKLPHTAKTKQRAAFMRYVEEVQAAEKAAVAERDRLLERPDVSDLLAK